MSFLGFGQSADIEIQLDDSENRKTADIKAEDGRKERCYLFYDGESISGKIFVKLKKMGMKLEHQGIKIEFIGQIEVYYDRGNHLEFISLIKDLARPGELLQNTVYPFEFVNVEKPYESYTGANVRLRYFLRVTIVRRLTDLVRELDIVVHTLSLYRDEMNSNIKMEVGIEDCLHIEFEYNRSKYHLKDAIVGKIYFLLVRIKIKHMEIAIIKRETVGSGVNVFNENETIAKYEIMDGAPVRGESIPIRLFLAGYDLTPTMREVNKKFSVRYFLNLVLVDEEDRRYFKQQEIVLWRKAEKVPRKPLASITPSAVMDRKPEQNEDEPDQKGPSGAGYVPSGTATKFIPSSSEADDADYDSDILKPPPSGQRNDDANLDGKQTKTVPPQPRPRGTDPASIKPHDDPSEVLAESLSAATVNSEASGTANQQTRISDDESNHDPTS